MDNTPVQLGDERYKWWDIYCMRKERLARLIELDAPAALIAKNRKLVKEAEKMCIMLAYRD